MSDRPLRLAHRPLRLAQHASAQISKGRGGGNVRPTVTPPGVRLPKSLKEKSQKMSGRPLRNDRYASDRYATTVTPPTVTQRPLRLAARVCPNIYRKKGGTCQTDRYASRSTRLPKSLREDGGEMSDRPLRLAAWSAQISIGKITKNVRPTVTPRATDRYASQHASAQISIGKRGGNVRPTVTPRSASQRGLPKSGLPKSL